MVLVSRLPGHAHLVTCSSALFFRKCGDLPAFCRSTAFDASTAPFYWVVTVPLSSSFYALTEYSLCAVKLRYHSGYNSVSRKCWGGTPFRLLPIDRVRDVYGTSHSPHHHSIPISPSPSLHHHHSLALTPSLRRQHSIAPSALPSFYRSSTFDTSMVVPGVGEEEEEKCHVSFWRVCACWGTHLHHVNSFSSGISWNRLPGPLFIGVGGDCGPCQASKNTNRPSKKRRLSRTYE